MVPRPRSRLLEAVLIVAVTYAAAGCSDRPASTGEPPASAKPSAAVPPQASTVTPLPSGPSASISGGDPRTGGYWEMWSTCGPNSQAGTAAANGGREAGWIIADDLIQDPGIEVGPLHVADCAQGLALLRLQAADGSDHAGDPTYQLAAQLYTTELNLAAGARSCAELEGTVIAAQAILAELDFDGTGVYLTSVGASDYVATIAGLVTRLTSYNSGGLC